MLGNVVLIYFILEFLKHLANTTHGIYEIGIATVFLLFLVVALEFAMHIDNQAK